MAGAADRARAVARRVRRLAAAALAALWLASVATSLAAPPLPPALTAPVNDFARVIDPTSAADMDRMIRALLAATGDVVAVATVDTIAPYADAQEYAVKMFENHGRGVGQKGRDNGLLVLLAVKERQVRVEVGYELEGFVTDGFAGETSREVMAPLFRRGLYGEGLKAGVARIIGRIAEGRHTTLDGVPVPADIPAPRRGGSWSVFAILGIIILVLIINRIGRPPGGGGRSSWGGTGRGWNSGVGPFGGPFGGGGFGGGFGGLGGGGGGGFGGFGGGRSGGGGGGAGW